MRMMKDSLNNSDDNAAENNLIGLFKKNHKRKRLMLNGINLLMTLILIPLLRFRNIADYGIFRRVILLIAAIAVFIQNLRQSSCLKKQLADLPKHTLECVCKELEGCPCYRKIFYFTSAHLFSTEGIILPYYEITKVLTRSYISTVGFSTNMVIKTRSYGRCVIPVGIGYLSEGFYDTLERKCPNADIDFRCTFQKAAKEEYFNTIKANSINVIRKKIRAENNLIGLFKKNHKRKRLMLNGINLLMTLILIPLLRFRYGTDYSLFWRILMLIVTIAVFIQNLRQSSYLKKQLADLSEHTLECVFKELEGCPCYRKIFYFTSEHLFSTEGIILPYYEITKVLTRSYISTVGFSTNMVIKTRSYGRCVIPVGIGYLSEGFYDTLERKCPNADIDFRCTFQKAAKEEYFNTIKANSINVIRKKIKQED